MPHFKILDALDPDKPWRPMESDEVVEYEVPTVSSLNKRVEKLEEEIRILRANRLEDCPLLKQMGFIVTGEAVTWRRKSV